MRVIAGKAKGIHLQAVPGGGTRPISDRVKEALFDILSSEIVNARVLDLFAGTGSVGIEALSRGAAEAVFVEKQSRATATIRANLRRTGLEGNARIVQADVFRYLGGDPTSYDLIYVAPPQYQELWSKTLLALDTEPGWLHSEGLVIVQIFPKELESLPLTSLQLIDQRRYGSTLLCFFELLVHSDENETPVRRNDLSHSSAS
jgi:16S rRNA (guanine(966)-N(2))-methyltransferase RsmD